MNGCELVSFISALSCIISQDRDADELGLLAVVFTQLGDSLAVIAAKKGLIK